ncbi:hypothetical protein EV195_10459 [Tenacibaculum skagerrakense]|uniref:Uncharacterized protein n=1 Tax=Tenacibaculum skagerrakense TaxID=186571 RepID=A0A4R2NU73_9FLAO|nr:hypothetical protein [Tenacibaculum skagerrakense]TCP25028.1 hypothetical protein EV195_10459 [Tenacibaculum skagerrakense]
MKAIKIVALAMVVTVVSFIGCQKDEDAVNPNVEVSSAERPYNALMYKDMIGMLEHYDKTRKPVLENALGFEDTRINHYSIETLENYIKYVKQLSKEKGIEFTGINFVSVAYPKNTGHGVPNYQNIMLMPTTNINAKNIAFDPVQSSKEEVVTMKEMFAHYGYNWVYDSKEDYEGRKVVSKRLQENFMKRRSTEDLESSSSNYGHLSPSME